MAITAKDVQALREMTGVGMMDCKKALTEAEGNMDKAVEILREKGLAASQKKAGRIAAEGMAYAAVIDGVGVVVEVNAETDFVAKNEKFVDFVKGVAATVAANKPADLDALMACKFVGADRTVTEQQQEMVLVIGENIKVRRFALFTEGVSVPYIHAGGKIGVLVNLETNLTAEQVNEAGKDLAMQIAALNPRFLDKSQVTQDVLDEEKKIMLVQMSNDPKMANKPADLDALMACKFVGTDRTVTEQQQEMVLVIGENIKVRRFALFTEGVSVPYIHAGGKIGVLVNLETNLTAEQVNEAGKDLAMQIAALNPRFLDKSQVTQDVLDEEKKIMLVQMSNDPKMANKPDQVKEKIVDGKLNKFYSENCLLQQDFVKDGDVTVEKYLANVAKAMGGTITLKDAVRFEKGEGIEKKQENFAEEIAKQLAK